MHPHMYSHKPQFAPLCPLQKKSREKTTSRDWHFSEHLHSAQSCATVTGCLGTTAAEKWASQVNTELHKILKIFLK